MKINKGDIKKGKGAYTPKAIVIMIDEMSEVMSGSNYRLVSSIQEDIGSIARLGRAAGCHLVLASQRPSSNVINADLKNNIQQSVILGDFDSGASTLVLDEDISHLSKPEIKGRGFIKNGKTIQEFQSYWTEPEKDFRFNPGSYAEEQNELKKKKKEKEKNKDDLGNIVVDLDNKDIDELLDERREKDGIISNETENNTIPEKEQHNDDSNFDFDFDEDEMEKRHNELMKRMRRRRQNEENVDNENSIDDDNKKIIHRVISDEEEEEINKIRDDFFETSDSKIDNSDNSDVSNIFDDDNDNKNNDISDFNTGDKISLSETFHDNNESSNIVNKIDKDSNHLKFNIKNNNNNNSSNNDSIIKNDHENKLKFNLNKNNKKDLNNDNTTKINLNIIGGSNRNDENHQNNGNSDDDFNIIS